MSTFEHVVRAQVLVDLCHLSNLAKTFASMCTTTSYRLAAALGICAASAQAVQHATAAAGSGWLVVTPLPGAGRHNQSNILAAVPRRLLAEPRGVFRDIACSWVPSSGGATAEVVGGSFSSGSTVLQLEHTESVWVVEALPGIDTELVASRMRGNGVRVAAGPFHSRTIVYVIDDTAPTAHDHLTAVEAMADLIPVRLTVP